MKNKYEVLGIVGEGAYGIVYKCLNKETNKFVAVKKFKETHDKLVQKTMKRELAMLQMLHHENVVEFQESFVSKGNFFLVFEYVEKNLLEVLEESPRGLSPKLIRSLVYQMCKAVDYLHKNNMIHRDVKPENLLIDEKLNLKLCDFGFARKVKLNKNNNNIDTMTDYVATRWYRSPELLLSGGIYGPEVDYWAIGCIMGELADGNAMFPGEDEVDQLDCIIKILGNLPESLVNMYYENQIYNGKELLKVKKPETLEKRYLGILSPTAIDFMKGLLELDPSKRLSGENVFKHKYFSIFMKNKYEVLGIVGEGAYGIVYKCLNKETNKYVAVKKFKETQDKLVQKTMKRELAMLQMLHHENVVEFQESFVSKGNFFLVFEYVEKNLLEVLEESPHGLSPKLIRSLVYQMCKAVDYLHKNNMIHRDVKPENLLIDEKLNLKLCDFGFARKVKLNKNNNNVDTMTDYVATRWYRSPELLLSGGIYGPEVDYWAIGCIMGELADGNPMFPGEDEVDQLDCIIKILGNLPENLINMYYENQIYNGKELLKVKKPETLEKRYLGILSPTAIDFMKGLLELDPSKRLSGENVFKHKYFSIFMKNNNNNNNINNNENNEAVANNAINPNNNLNNNNSNNAANIKVIKDDKSINNKINNSININKIVIKNNPNSNLLLSNSNTKRNDVNIMKESKSNVTNKNMNMNINIKEKEEINSKKSEKDKQSDNAYSNRNNNNNSINNIVNNINQK